MDASPQRMVPEEHPQGNRDTTASTPSPRNTERENARRLGKMNLEEEIRAAQRDVSQRERRIEPLRLGLKNARARLARLQKKQKA